MPPAPSRTLHLYLQIKSNLANNPGCNKKKLEKQMMRMSVLFPLCSELSYHCDLTSAGPNYDIFHLMSSDLVMGAGVARCLNEHFLWNQPEDWDKYHFSHYTPNPDLLGTVIEKQDPISGRRIYNGVSKLRYNHIGSMSVLPQLFQALRRSIELNGTRHLAIPRLGSGRDRLPWPLVLEELKAALSGVPIIIKVHFVPDKYNPI